MISAIGFRRTRAQEEVVMTSIRSLASPPQDV